MTRVASLVIGVFLVGGCHGKAGEKATPESCRKGCEHAADLNQEGLRANSKIRVHEMEEMLEGSEDIAKETIKRLKQEMETPRPRFEDTLDGKRKLSPVARAQLRERYEQQGADERKQQEAALKSEEETLVDTRKKIDSLAAQNEKDLKSAHDADAKRCVDDCVQNFMANQVECLVAAQSAEDVPLCLKKK